MILLLNGNVTIQIFLLMQMEKQLRLQLLQQDQAVDLPGLHCLIQKFRLYTVSPNYEQNEAPCPSSRK